MIHNNVTSLELPVCHPFGRSEASESTRDTATVCPSNRSGLAQNPTAGCCGSGSRGGEVTQTDKNREEEMCEATECVLTADCDAPDTASFSSESSSLGHTRRRRHTRRTVRGEHQMKFPKAEQLFFFSSGRIVFNSPNFVATERLRFEKKKKKKKFCIRQRCNFYDHLCDS